VPIGDYNRLFVIHASTYPKLFARLGEARGVRSSAAGSPIVTVQRPAPTFALLQAVRLPQAARAGRRPSADQGGTSLGCCSSGVTGLPIATEAKPHCGLSTSSSSGFILGDPRLDRALRWGQQNRLVTERFVRIRGSVPQGDLCGRELGVSVVSAAGVRGRGVAGMSSARGVVRGARPALTVRRCL
jgi:hypothetical protein